MTESISRKFSRLGLGVSDTGTLTVNSATATKWATARTLTLTGDVSGNVSIDGSENVTLTATVSGNSVALGTDTTGDYVASITNGNYITGGNGGSEGATLTLAVDATSANTASKVVARDASGNFSAGTITATLSGNASTVTNGVYTTDTGTVTNTMLAGSIANNKLANSTISGISLGSNLATLTLGVSGTGLSGSQTYNGSGAATFTVTSNATSANTASTIVARDASGNFTAGTITAALSGNATTATTLQTARTINGVSFNGSADITVADSTKLPLAGGTMTGTITGGMSAGAQVVEFANADNYVSMRVIRNNAASANRDGMYIGYGNVNSGATRIYGAGSVSGHALIDASGNWFRSDGVQYVLNTGTWGINVTGTAGSISGFNNPTTASTANTIAYRTSLGDIAVRELILEVGVQSFTPSSMVAIFPTTNQAVKVDAAGARNFLDVPTRSGGNASGTWSINVTGSAGAVAWSNVSSRPSNIMYYQGFTLDANTMDSNSTGFTYAVNAPYVGPVVRFSTNGSYDMWFNAPYIGGNDLAYRTRNGDNGTLNPWKYILNTSNYNSYSPTLTGGGASGTWGISISGNAATATSADQIDGWGFVNTGSNASTNPDSIDSNGISYTIATLPFSQGDGALYSQRFSTSWQHQIFGDYRSGQIAVRGRNAGNWQSWRAVLDSSNFSSYALPLSGGTFTGNLVGAAGTCIRFGNANESDSNDGKIGAALFASGLNIVGTQTVAGAGRIVRLWGAVMTDSSQPFLHSGNFSSYALPLSGGTLTGGVTAPSYTLSGGFSITHPGSGYASFNNWVLLPGTHGFYSGNNSAHFYPNNGVFGAWRISGSRNSYNGIEFDAGNGNVVLMVRGDSNVSGMHNNGYGWHYYWEGGTFYIGKNTFGGNMVVALDASNYSSYALPLSGGTVSGRTDFTAGTYPALVLGEGNHSAVAGVGLQILSYNNNGATMSFHRWGFYAVNMSLDSDNVFRIGGWSAAANRLQMDMSGNLTMAGNVTAYSDVRLKNNIETITDALTKVLRLRGVSFTRNDQEDTTRKHIGVIAQELEEVVPEVVFQDASETKNVAYGNMIGLLIEAIKEQQRKIEELENRINNS